MNPETLRKKLCQTFCTSISVRPVPSGLAVRSVFKDRSGDPISFYIVQDGEGYRIEDDGEYLARLVGSNIPINQGSRGQLLEAILAEGGAAWNQDTYEIYSNSFRVDEITERAMDFLSALIRVRDLELLTRDFVYSTFREDATAALMVRFSEAANFNDNQAVDRSFSEFPADLVIRPKFGAQGKIGVIYFVTSNDKLNEALLLQMEAEKLNRNDFKIVALIEDSEMRSISKSKFQRAQNRSLTMPIFRGDEDAAVNMIGRDLGLAVAA